MGVNPGFRWLNYFAWQKDYRTALTLPYPNASSVLLCGETGICKELVARALHYNSKKKDKPFVALNCAGIPRELIESELFRYEKGAFTGAVSRRIGKIEEASGGICFYKEYHRESDYPYKGTYHYPSGIAWGICVSERNTKRPFTKDPQRYGDPGYWKHSPWV